MTHHRHAQAIDARLGPSGRDRHRLRPFGSSPRQFPAQDGAQAPISAGLPRIEEPRTVEVIARRPVIIAVADHAQATLISCDG